MPTPLADLELSPLHVRELSGNERSRLLNFLLRWEDAGAVHACLDALAALTPDLVSLLDLRVRAFLAQGRAGDALGVIEERLARKTSTTARVHLARVHLALGDLDAAHAVAHALTSAGNGGATAWGLLGEVELARGDTAAALAAYRRLNELSPQSRAYLLGTLAIYEAGGDRVTASAYAVRLLRSEAEEGPLPVDSLRRLRAYFQASGEATRVADLDAALAQRYTDELAELRAALARFRRPDAAVEQETVEAAPAPGPGEGDDEQGERTGFPATFDQVPVSEEERARIAEANLRWFGFATFLPGQLETLACALRGEDVLTVLPTGGGKSLCYQLPALLAERGTTLVISPLIALMKDQVDSLPDRARHLVTTINSSLEGDELRARLDRAADGALRLIYAAPERLRQPPFLHALRRAGVNRLVIDEVHCVSVWGHDFRPDYLTIGQARRALGNPPLLGLTATAPPRVRLDILDRLGSSPAGQVKAPQGRPDHDIRIVAGDVTRSNLYLEVFYARNADDKLGRLLAFCQAQDGSGIVYAGTRARCEELAALLRGRGVAAGHYHAGIPDRDRVQDDFMAGRLRVVVATVAFGMGIDKPDIRFIVHFVPPPSLEAYYQEAGRAGRDGLPAHCLLMYAPSDRATLTRRAREDLLPVQFLRATYAAVKERLHRLTAGRVAAADLGRDLQAEEVRVRVALSLLQEAGLLRRGPDLPRAATLCLADMREDAALPPDLRALCDAARLRPGQPLTLDLADAARRAGLPLDDVERRVLVWADAGLLGYRPAGRDLLLELLPPPPDAAERVAALLERYETVQAQRVDEIAAYAQTGRCRHGYLNAYLGGRAIGRCATCDNCVGAAPAGAGAAAAAALPEEREQFLTILQSVAGAPWGWGRRSLAHILRGDGQAHPKAHGQPGFGALAFRSATAVDGLLGRLERGGFLQARRLDHGGEVLELAPPGTAALQDPAGLDRLLTPPERPQVKPATTRQAAAAVDEAAAQPPAPPVDEALFQSLRAWRAEQARAQSVPPYVVFHDSHLRAIAAHLPLTLEALSALKGIGPRKLEQYGAALVEMVRRHLDGKNEGDG